MSIRNRVLLATAALGFAAAQPASAGQPGAISSTSWIMTDYCGGNSFVSCATVTATVSGSVLTMTVTNTGGSYNNGRFGAIGFIGATTGTIAAFGANCAVSSCVSGAGSWDVDNDINDLQINGVSAKGADENAGDGLFVNETVTFQFRLTSGTWDLTNAILGLREQGAGTGGCSNKTYISASGQNLANQSGTVIPLPTNESFQEQCGIPDNPDPNTSIPEPATVGLMALGLVGLGGINVIRRRRKV